MSDHQQHRKVIIILVVLLFVMSSLIFFSLGRSGLPSSGLMPVSDVAIINLDADDAVTNGFLHEEEVVVVETVSTSTGSATTEVLPVDRVLFEYVEVVDGCGPHFQGDCLNVRSGPGTDYPTVASLRNGMVLKVGGKVEREYDKASTTYITVVSSSSTPTEIATTTIVTVNETWYKIIFDEWLRYPERLKSDWYVNADFVEILLDEGDKTSWEDGNATTTNKQITVDRGDQKLYAYDGSDLFLEADISTGLSLTPTPRGTFTIFKKTPSRYMQGPLPNLVDKQRYDLPGVPWNLYFTNGGAVIHGAYWHDSFGSRYSHGCVNLPPDTARELYEWADLGTIVIVKD